MSGLLEGRIALVTGASRGIGRAIAQELAQRGAAVAVNYRTRVEDAEKVVREIRSWGGTAVALGADVSIPGEAELLVEQTMRRLGGLHILVNNAGATGDGLIYETTFADWWKVLEVNLGGTFNCTTAVAEHFMSQYDGAIVNMSSIMGDFGLPGQSNYSTSKGAINSFTYASAVEFARFGVRVNAVLGGIIPTDLISHVMVRDDGRGRLQIPMRRYGTVEDIAATVAFLAGPEASYITGELIRVDGGLSCRLGLILNANAHR
ncbi:SDR family NAD(P)-dependent oxidoreductase [Nocardia transvalensis]|uniref:SDR family NAD(P)-dependent oxidoreductase n=1 Tax=Nocardia transvalensis TaxID=37333 RepID=UPI0018942378|nr:3-oxoacyl-ACP reductase family protein [Nocardia transvalensis]MBF6329923.1 3-oxoacyl-ACP reductase FabG [Nocardia transvalensis]